MKTNKEIVEGIMKEYGDKAIEEIESFYKNNKKDVDRILEVFTKCILKCNDEQKKEKDEPSKEAFKDLMCNQLNAYRSPEELVEAQKIKNRINVARLQMQLNNMIYEQRCRCIQSNYYPDYRTYDNMSRAVSFCEFQSSFKDPEEYSSIHCK